MLPPASRMEENSSTRHCVSAAMAPTSSRVAKPSQMRISIVPRFATGRISQRISDVASMTPVVNMSWT
ncbi:hypothetical protein D3C72_2506630 [compost metagenome]